MKTSNATNRRLPLTGLVACLLCLPLTVNAANGLRNPSFEDPLGTNTNDNNLDLAPVDWSTTGRPNLVRVDGTGYSGGPATAQTGIQYLDIINASGFTSQGFTLDAGSWSVKFSAWFSNREEHVGGTYTSTFGIYDTAGTTPVLSLVTVNLSGDAKPSTGWTKGEGTGVLAAGSYRFRVNLDDSGNTDSTYVEASTCRILSLKSTGGGLYGTAAFTATLNGSTTPSSTYDIVFQPVGTGTGSFTGLIYNDGQFPVVCGVGAVECLSPPSPTPSLPSISNLTGLTFSGSATITFGNGTYTYVGAKFGEHSGTYTQRDCATVPEPGTLLLMLLPLAGLRAIRRHRLPA